MPRILFIDNYDSFTYNVVELLRQIGGLDIVIKKNDELTDININDYNKLIISPGPDLPSAANGLMNFIEKNIEHIPTLGICLGHQAIAQYYGAELLQYKNPMHGEQTKIMIQNAGVLFNTLPQSFMVGLYHSWYVSQEKFPNVLQPLAINNSGILMAMQHKSLPIYSVQFHPESYMSENGTEILQNFIRS